MIYCLYQKAGGRKTRAACDTDVCFIASGRLWHSVGKEKWSRDVVDPADKASGVRATKKGQERRLKSSTCYEALATEIGSADRSLWVVDDALTCAKAVLKDGQTFDE